MTTATNLSGTFPVPFQSGGKVSSRFDPVVDQSSYRWAKPLNGPPFHLSGRESMASERDSCDSYLYREIAVENPIYHTETMLPVTPIRSTRRTRSRHLHRSCCRSGVRTRIWGVRPLGTIRALGDGISRDPIGERGGKNLYGFVRNSPISLRDTLGKSVDPNAIISPDTAVEFSRLGPTFVSEWLMRIARSPVEIPSYDWVRSHGADFALALNAYYNWPGGSGNGFNKFVFTCKCGWIDSGHFWLSALGGYSLDADRSFLLGVFVEEIQSLSLFGEGGWSDSRYTAEDLPTDLLGSAFGQSLKGKDYNSIPRLFKDLLEECGAVDPTKLTSAQWQLLRNEARQWSKDLTQNTDAYPTRGKACTALCPGTKQSLDDDFTSILQRLGR
jgi:hypothetical protein